MLSFVYISTKHTHARMGSFQQNTTVAVAETTIFAASVIDKRKKRKKLFIF